MSPKTFLPAFFLISLAVAAQNVSPAPGLIINGGYVVGPVGNGQVQASTVTFGSPAPVAGASSSGIAGISDQTPIQPGVSTNLPASTVVYTTAAPVNVVYTNQSGANVAGAQEATSQAPVNDLTPTIYSGSNAAGTPGNASFSLGEVSAQNKARNGAQRARSYTNSDVQRLISHQGAGNVMEAANRPPAGIVPPGQNPPSSSNTAPTTQTNLPQSTAGSQQSATASQQGSASAETSTANQSAPSNDIRQNAGTTPQIAQPKQTETQQNSQQLPATSTMLPLLGLLGITASGVGLWFRRSRR